MRELRILSLTLDNFKGQRHLPLDFGGKSATIYGDNAAGKTTLYDAVTWLLFGKDSHGQSTFDIKPLGPDGQVLDHSAITTVEAVFSCDGVSVALKKTYYEKWSSKRGSAEETYDGNTSDYFVDGVPSKKYEFERRVGDMVGEDVFRQLTDVKHFCSALEWKERRRVLFDVCGVASDLEIMERDERFQPLQEAAGHLALDDYRKKLQAERKGLMGVRNDVPVRLDECKKVVEELEDIDFFAIHKERDTRAEKRDKLAAELLKLDHNTLLDSKRNERGALENQIAKLRQDNEAFRRSQVVQAVDERPAITREVDGLKRNIIRWTEEKTACDAEAKRCEEEVQACRERWAEINGRIFDCASCPTCGQAMSGKLLEEARERFELERAVEFKDVVKDSDNYKAKIAAAGQRRESLISEIVGAENRISELTDKLANVKPVEQPAIMDMSGFEKAVADLAAQVEALDNEIAALAGESASIKAETKVKIAALDDEISAISTTLAKEGVLSYTKERMEALQEEARAAASELEQLEQALFLIEEFTRFKVQFIEESINDRFKLARFKLFDEQVNGGLAECCEATVDGVPYQSLNNGARINVGMDVIGILSEHYGVSVPLFVDNAESVTALLPINAQVVRLMVSAEDKKLRCEYGA